MMWVHSNSTLPNYSILSTASISTEQTSTRLIRTRRICQALRSQGVSKPASANSILSIIVKICGSEWVRPLCLRFCLSLHLSACAPSWNRTEIILTPEYPSSNFCIMQYFEVAWNQFLWSVAILSWPRRTTDRSPIGILTLSFHWWSANSHLPLGRPQSVTSEKHTWSRSMRLRSPTEFGAKACWRNYPGFCSHQLMYCRYQVPSVSGPSASEILSQPFPVNASVLWVFVLVTTLLL